MPLSRTLLMINAISNKIKEAVSRDCDMEDVDLDTIKALLFESNPTVRPTILQGLAAQFKVLPLCKLDAIFFL